MGEIKEPEEARIQIDYLIEDIWCDAQGRVTNNIKHWKQIRRDQILNLKGDGWRIAIIEDSETVWVLQDDGDPDSKRVPFKQVIWQAGE